MKNMVRVTSIAVFFGVLAVLIMIGMGLEVQQPTDIYMEQAPLAAVPMTVTGQDIQVKPEEASKPIVTTAYKNTSAVNAAPVQYKKQSDKTVYLTFDDGPSDLTLDVLNILKREGIKGTFFVLGKEAETRPEIINRIYEEGHVIGNHTYDHRYDKLYGHFQDFWGQIKKTEEIIRLITGERPQLVRAPGGTAGHFDEAYFQFMKQGGYHVFDWNVDSGDSRYRDVPVKDIVKGATTKVNGNEAIVLLHDGRGHTESVKALPDIISYYKKQGYAFDVLSPEIQPVQFRAQQSARKVSQPSKQWIEEHVAANAALFETGRTLAVEFGGMETAFAAGEYKMVDGRLMVPLRALVERLGGSVSWKSHNKTVQVTLAGNRWEADPVGGLLFPMQTGGKPVSSDVHLIGGTAWIPLREALDFSGRPVTRVTYEESEYRVLTL
ncbi:polysaccharide deacetylase [Paenibacillus sp. ISL-20]|uniref:polysaccharide deacetylase n=1 Tax=Paenibacillus sp. ISL-20 TaxID=2819163 RepID=UPI001BE650B8|nr:polysaccharide deacetylase [Paenibacillus sp. ISL-20]MBT2763192.1 polysaccharide deacetylase family protein [Paenibacillus sp. ISL-20]